MTQTKIALYSANGFQETFTKAHLDRLPVTFSITGGTPPRMVNGKFMVPMNGGARLWRKLKGVQIDEFYPFDYFLKTQSPDVLVAEYGMAGAVSTALCKKYSVPLIVNFYGIDAFGIETLERFSKEYQDMFSYASFICTQSQSIKKALIGMGCPVDKVVVNPGPPSELFFEREACPKFPVFIFVGRFVDKKAPYITLMAFRHVLTHVPEARLIMVGDGPLYNACVNLAKIWCIEDRVEFTGRLNPVQQRDKMCEASVYVQHSITALNGDAEGLPVAIMEASALGLPVISTRHSGIPEAIEDQITGVLVDELDVEGMKRTMIDVLNDPDRMIRMGQAGRRRMQEHFTMEKHIHCLEELIERAVRKE